MGKRLSDNLSSLYIGAANRLKPKKARRKIVAYVESYDDVSFWRTLLGEFEDDTRYFEVMLPSKTTLAKGKKSVLMNELGSQLGQNMIACVDSDYDYLPILPAILSIISMFFIRMHTPSKTINVIRELCMKCVSWLL